MHINFFNGSIHLIHWLFPTSGVAEQNVFVRLYSLTLYQVNRAIFVLLIWFYLFQPLFCIDLFAIFLPLWGRWRKRVVNRATGDMQARRWEELRAQLAVEDNGLCHCVGTLLVSSPVMLASTWSSGQLSRLGKFDNQTVYST